MKKHSLLVLFGIAAVLMGCIPTLHPLYTEKDLIFDPALVGRWAEENSKESWTFEKEGENAYKLTYLDGEKKGEFQAHLLKLGEARFLDLFPDEAGLKENKRNDFYNFHFMPMHSFIKVLQVSPTLEMSLMEAKWLDELIKKEPKTIPFEKEGDRVVLTASTKELQTFVLRHLRTPEAWGEASKLKRQ